MCVCGGGGGGGGGELDKWDSETLGHSCIMNSIIGSRPS